MFKCIIWGIWFLLFYVVALASAPNSSLFNPHLKQYVNVLFPQGWAFFTKDPTGTKLEIYKIEESGFNLVDLNNSSIENQFGISKISRGVSKDLEKILKIIPKKSWIKAQGPLDNIVNEYLFTSIPSKGLKYIRPGKYLMKKNETVPFLWAQKVKVSDLPYSYIKIIIS